MKDIEKKYGDNYKQHLLEQYKLYVEMADRISARRAQTNKFFISMLTGLLAVLSLSTGKNFLTHYQIFVFFVISFLGLVLNIVWYVNIRSYRQLNTGKFKVIHEMEQQLAFAPYDKEWEILGHGKDSKRYFQLTRVEQYVPFILAIPYMLLLIYSVIKMCRV